MAERDMTVEPWGDGFGSPPIKAPNDGNKYNFTAKTGVKSVRGACVKLNDGYDILDWPFPFAYVYSESVGEWFAIFQRGFKRPTVPDPDWIEPEEPLPPHVTDAE